MNFKVDSESQDLCTFISLFGKYKNARLPIPLKCSHDIAPGIIEKTLLSIKDADKNNSDVCAFSKD
jgi:hypothetical protein